MYLKPSDTWHTRYTHDTCRIHRDTFEDTYLEPYLRPRAWIPQTPEIRVPHVSRMYSACILITSEDTCISHVSRMYPACLLHIRYISLWMHLRYMYLIMYLGCIPHVSWSPLQIHVSRMYPASKIHVSWFCILLYFDVLFDEESKMHVSWCILMYPVVYPVWHIGSEQIHVSWCIWCVSQNVSWTRLGYV